MFDRLFMPALTFTLIVAATAAFAGEIGIGQSQAASAAPPIVTLERVVVTASAADRLVARAEQASDAAAR